jgi:hypothetical protein
MLSIDEAVFVAKEADYAIICIGEEHYAEKPGDLNRELSLPKEQQDLIQVVSNATKENGGGGSNSDFCWWPSKTFTRYESCI